MSYEDFIKILLYFNTKNKQLNKANKNKYVIR